MQDHISLVGRGYHPVVEDPQVWTGTTSDFLAGAAVPYLCACGDLPA